MKPWGHKAAVVVYVKGRRDVADHVAEVFGMKVLKVESAVRFAEVTVVDEVQDMPEPKGSDASPRQWR